MQEIKIYEYATVRLVPKVEREEFFNVGLIMFCKKSRYIRFEAHLSQVKFDAMKSKLDESDISTSLSTFSLIAKGDQAAGPIALFEIPERFRWLTAVGSSVIQTSRPHPGKTTDLDATFDKLFSELVK